MTEGLTLRRTKKQTEMNNILERINSRITEAEERIDDLKDRMKEIAAIEQNIEKKNEDSLRDLWDNIKHINIRIIGVPGEQREQGPEKIFEEIISEKFPNMGKEIVNQVQEAQKVPGRINSKRNTLRHIVIKLTKTKDKDKTLKATRGKPQTTQGNFHTVIN